MTPFWIINAALWTLLLIYVFPGAWAAGTGKRRRREDSTYLAVSGTAVMMAGFSYRWLLAPNDPVSWKMLYILSAGLCVFKFLLLRAYGRGPLDGD
jgi:hypothetical protein